MADLKARLEQIERDNKSLRQELNQIKQEQSGSWLSERRKSEVQAMIQEVLADADTRASLLADQAHVGFINGAFSIGSPDGKFLMQIGGLIQARYIYNHRGMAPGGLDQMDNDESGFDLPRVRLEVGGWVGDPRFTYFIRFGPDREDNEVLGEKAVIGYRPSDSFAIYAGEDKAAFLREEIIGPGFQMAADRSLMNEVFTVGYVQGVWFQWAVHKDVTLYASINDGVRSGEADNESNSSFLTASTADSDLRPIHKPFFLDRTDIAGTFRVDWKIMGTWEQYEDFAAWSGEPTAIFLGGAIHAELGETGSGPGAGLSGDNDNFIMWTVDVSLEHEGLSIFAALVGLHTDLEVADNFDMFGAVIQLGYMVIPDKLEPFIRLEWIDLDRRNVTTAFNTAGDNDVFIVTIGFNYYVLRHRAKFTVDVMWIATTLPDSSILGLQDNDGFDQSLGHIGLRQDNDEDQIVIRIQFQVMF
ncbi:MAG: porin [Phycisphaeraceae bacterium]